ncbi:hypothetical protein [Dietzia alimentaria]|uniref:hypothetical protein n=1 Tax=Dietzia alimentaria TaxID=665550 RepID=UPI00029A9170|nr:hypothetical protein [Dietzia alimentaria]
MSITEIEGPDGMVWPVHGRGAGSMGVAMTEDSHKNLDVPVVTRWSQSANEPGAKLRKVLFEPTDMELVFVATDTAQRSVAAVDSEFRRAFDYKRETIVRTISPLSGARELRVVMRESPTKHDRFDMHGTKVTVTKFPVRAGMPFWAGQPEVAAVKASGGSGTGYLEMHNPTDLPMYPRWVLQAGARWEVPDFDFAGDNRVVGMPPEYTGHEVSIHTNPVEQMIRIAGWKNAQEAMRGILFDNVVPAHTPPTLVPVSWRNNTGSPVASVFMDRFWTRPWGME